MVPISDSHWKGKLHRPCLQGYRDKIKVARGKVPLCFYASHGIHVLYGNAALSQFSSYFCLWSSVIYLASYEYSFQLKLLRTTDIVKKAKQNKKPLKILACVTNCFVLKISALGKSTTNNLSLNFTHVKCYTSVLVEKNLKITLFGFYSRPPTLIICHL